MHPEQNKFRLETKLLEGVKTGDTEIIEFSDRIAQHVVCIKSFKLTYGDHDHNVLKMSISLQCNRNDNKLSVTPLMNLKARAGHELDPTKSYVSVAVMAWVGVNNENLLLTNIPK